MSGLTRLTLMSWLVPVLAASALAGVNEVRISNISGSYPANSLFAQQLMAGAPVTLEITFDATGGAGYLWSGTNAFEIYSPDGADWQYLEATRGQYIWDLPLKYTPPNCGTLESFLHHANKEGGSGTFVKTAYAGQIQKCFEPEPTLIDDLYTTLPAGGNVNGNDTAAFFIAAVGSGVGYEGGSSGVALYVEFTSFPGGDNGKHICFDTCSQFMSWEWSAAGYPGSDFPTWDNGRGTDGPRCWEIYQLPCGYILWCDGPTDNITRTYCQDISYQLCAEGHAMSFEEDLQFALTAPYSKGDYGSVDPVTGVWTCPGGTFAPGEHQVKFQAYSECVYSDPFVLNISVIDNSVNTDCCVGKVGDANSSGDDMPTVGDITILIDALFVTEDACILQCLSEADINLSGGIHPTFEAITIGDISKLIDYLFIAGPETFGPLPDCPVMQ